MSILPIYPKMQENHNIVILPPKETPPIVHIEKAENCKHALKVAYVASVAVGALFYFYFYYSTIDHG